MHAYVVQLGGFIGDWAAKRSPNHGRIAVAQVSVGLGVPLTVAVFKASSAGGLACRRWLPGCWQRQHSGRLVPNAPTC